MTRSTFAQRLRGLGRALNAWVTDLEYGLRIRRPFAAGHASTRVFFPGCALTAADPEVVRRTFDWLRARDPSIALWSDCCGMPLEKFAGPEAAARGRERTRAMLAAGGTSEVVTACGNCAVQFKALDVPGLRVTSLYRLLAAESWPAAQAGPPRVVHHPCSARVDAGQQADFAALAAALALPMAPQGKAHPLPCCLTKTEAAQRRRAALADRELVTYCAHCTVSFQGDIPTRHVLQELFDRREVRWRPRGKLGRFLQYFRFARWARRHVTPAAEPAPRLP